MFAIRCRNSARPARLCAARAPARRVRSLAALGAALCSSLVGAGAQEAPKAPGREPVGIRIEYTIRGQRKEVVAERLVFDGEAFTVTTSKGLEFRVPKNEIGFLDSGDLAQVNEEISVLRQIAEESKAPGAALQIDRVVQEHAHLRTRLAEVGKERDDALEKLRRSENRVSDMNKKIAQLENESRLAQDAQDRTTSQTAVHAADLAAKSAEIARLRKETDEMRKEIEDLKTEIDLADDPSRALKIVRTEGRGAASKETGLTVVEGTVANAAQRHYSAVVLEVSAYDSRGNLLGVGSTFVHNLGAREEGRVFRADVECDPTQVADVRITPVPLRER